MSDTLRTFDGFENDERAISASRSSSQDKLAGKAERPVILMIDTPPPTLQARRRFFEIAGGALLATQFASVRTADALPSLNGLVELAKFEPTNSFPSIKQINAGALDVGYAEVGPADGPVALLLHGWPYDIYSFVDVAPRLASAGFRIIMPYTRGYGSTRFLSSQTIRTGQPSAVAVDAIALLDALNIKQCIFAGFDWGGRTADIVAALWPNRVKGLVSVSGYLISSQEAGKAPLPPEAELQWWYQYYFATERGREGYSKYRRQFAELIWRLASPKWKFDDATFARSAAAFDNPDHVDIVIHNYRWRLGLADGDPKLDELEAKLAAAPDVATPTITLEGDANGAPHPPPAAYAKKFTGKYEHRLVTGGIGHNLPQEAPEAFAQAVIDVGNL
jgi:pimeloyl-ACP methyl ester carboxylesterase